MPLTEDMQAIVDMIAASGAPPVDQTSPAEARAAAAAMVEFSGKGPPVDRVEELEIPSADGAARLPARLLLPGPSPLGLIVYFHGGGWVMGNRDMFDPMARLLAVESGCAVALVDYRLAPEHRFPAAADDAIAATGWLQRECPRLLGRQLPLIVAGDSAGGNLAAVVSQQAGAHGLDIAAQLLVYPVAGARFDTDSYTRYADAPILTRSAMQWFWDHYLPDHTLRQDVRASPGLADDLANLPPAIIIAAEVDPLRTEGEDYARALAAAGVPVDYRCFEGVTHGFFGMINQVALAREAVRHAAEQVGRHCPAAMA